MTYDSTLSSLVRPGSNLRLRGISATIPCVLDKFFRTVIVFPVIFSTVIHCIMVKSVYKPSDPSGWCLTLVSVAKSN